MGKCAYLLVPLLWLAGACPGQTFASAPASSAVDDLASVARLLEVPFAQAPRLKTAPTAESAPDFATWGGPVDFTLLSAKSGAPPPTGPLAAPGVPVTTAGYFACDGEHLYLAVRCAENAMDQVKSVAAPADGDVWAGDNVEFMVLPGLDVQRPYFQFAVNPAGSLYDAQVQDKAWNSGAKVFTWRDRQRWTVVLAVPLKALGVSADDASPLWRINLHRSRPRRSGANEADMAWSPTGSTSNHVPSRFGLIHMVGLGKPLDAKAMAAQIERALKVAVVFRQDFGGDVAGFGDGAVAVGESPGGKESFLRLAGKEAVALDRNFGPIAGLNMALAYRTDPNQHGLVVQGGGTIVRATRPGVVEVIGRGLRTAQEKCQDADGRSTVKPLGQDSFLFKRPYGH